jgi:hypothetical protein
VAGHSKADMLSFVSMEAGSAMVQAGSAMVRPNSWRLRRRGMGRRRPPPLLEAGALEASRGWRRIRRPQACGTGGVVY